jgi:hypothetical protein
LVFRLAKQINKQRLVQTQTIYEINLYPTIENMLISIKYVFLKKFAKMVVKIDATTDVVAMLASFRYIQHPAFGAYFRTQIKKVVVVVLLARYRRSCPQIMTSISTASSLCSSPSLTMCSCRLLSWILCKVQNSLKIWLS